MNRILEMFYEQTGICFIEKQDIVLNKIENFSKNRNFTTIQSFLDEVKKGDDLWQELVNFLTVNETYFFRESRQLDILIDFAKNRHSFNILCLPSSSGEEVYTIAIMLDMAGILNNLGKIIGIDINSSVIEKAKRAEYGKRSFHKTDDNVKNQYLIENNGYYTVKDFIKSKCEFHTMNIFDNRIQNFGEFDFLLSRNMLIYFDKHSRHRAANVFAKLVKPGGNLFLGHADILDNEQHFTKRMQNGSVYYEFK